MLSKMSSGSYTSQSMTVWLVCEVRYAATGCARKRASTQPLILTTDFFCMRLRQRGKQYFEPLGLSKSTSKSGNLDLQSEILSA